MAAALFAAGNGCAVHLFEHNEKLGKKLFITGKGRCNFTNASDPETMLASVVSNPRFLMSAFHTFTSEDAIALFERLGVRTKVERGQRAFPASDHSSDIIRAVERELRRLDVKVHLKSGVRGIVVRPAQNQDVADATDRGAVFSPDDTPAAADRKGKKRPDRKAAGVILENGQIIEGDAVILATGGLSYPSTGSTGDGYRMAEEVGHTVTPTRPALVPLVTAENFIPKMQGLSLKNVRLTIPWGKKKEFSEFGEMMFTHFGITGPLVLSASSVIGRALGQGPLTAHLDVKPAITREQLDARLLREFGENPNKELKNILPDLYPSKLRPVILERTGVPEFKAAHDITREERAALVSMTKDFTFTITGQADYGQAVITQGGVSVREVNPSTMESKKVRDLYLTGEILDVDALTGGFNLQIAWSTAYLAAQAIAASDGAACPRV